MDIVPSKEKTLKVKTFVESLKNSDVLDANINAFIYREKLVPSDIVELKMSALSQSVSISTGQAYSKEKEGRMYIVCTLMYLSQE